MPDLEYHIKTTGDLRALTEAKHGFEADKKALLELGHSAADVEKELEKVNKALSSQAARAVAAAEALDRTAARVKALGGDAGHITAARDTALLAGGIKPGAATDREAAIKSSVELQKALAASRADYQRQRDAVDRAESAHRESVRAEQAKVLEAAKKSSQQGAFGRAVEAYKNNGGGAGGLRAGAMAMGAGAGGLLAGGAAIVGATKAVSEYADAQERMAKLDAALAQDASLFEPVRGQLQGLAEDMGRVTGIASGEWIGAITTLTQFGVGPEKMKEGVEAVKNLAALMGGDLASAAMLIGKAANGSFESFSRLGIQFDEHATKAEKLAKLYEVLRQRGAGQLEAANDTLAGSYRRLKNGMGDLAQGVGAVIAHMVPLKEIASGVGNALGKLGGMMTGTIEKQAGLRNSTVATAGTMIDASERADQYAGKLKKIKEQADEASTALGAFMKLTQEEQDLKIAEAEAKKNLDLAIINEKEKKNLISPTSAEVQRAKVEENFVKFKVRTQDETQKKMAEQLRREADAGQAQINQAESLVAAEKEKLEAMKAAADVQRKVRERFQPEIEAAEQTASDEAGKFAVAGAEGFGGSATPSRAGVEEVERRMEAELAAAGGGAKVTAATIQQQEGAIQDAKKLRDDMKEMFGGRVAQQRSEAFVLEQRRQSNSRVEGFNEITRDVGRDLGRSEARARERGEVERTAGGISGSPAAMNLESQTTADQRQLEQMRGNGAGGQQRVDAILRGVAREREQNARLLDVISRNQETGALTITRVRQLEDRQARLESMLRNGGRGS